MGKSLKKVLCVLSSVAMILCLITKGNNIYAAIPEYEIYPKPHDITYQDNDFILRQKVNVVYSDAIDSYTKTRLEEVLNIKDLTLSTSDKWIDNAVVESEDKVLNILIGINGSNDVADAYVRDNYSVSNDLFEKIDSYYLKIDNETIVILGRDVDSTFYGLTSLYHIFNQLDSRTIRNLEIKDYADVISRGYIEGYYGSPWSTEDRIDLMKFGGYNKLNSYFYAPKDDAKHNEKWRDLYTQDELDTKIKPLALAGNESKCRFVFALHPYMHNPIRHGNETDYKADLATMQAKFDQVLKVGVRQIAILADDADNVGGSNYIRMLEDMTTWLKEKQKTYPDLKLTLPFCVKEYMSYGESYYSQFPDNVQIIMTGGRVFGEVSNDFTSRFTSKVGRGPYMWINWPCTDNSRQHLIMGGYDIYLQEGVNPTNIEGIVLNPMQQSEPSKVALFGNAAYSWNIWESKAEADEVWNDSFKYVNHNSSDETKASLAFKEISKHMMNQNIKPGADNPATPIQESVDLKVKLDRFKKSLSSNTVTKEQIKDLIQEFEIIKNAAKTYKNSGNKRMVSQIIYWLDCLEDTSSSAISYLQSIHAILENDSTTLMNEYANGQKSFAASKKHGFIYRDYTEYAEVGVQHIVPFIKSLDSYLSGKMEGIVNPDLITTTYISDVFTTAYTGSDIDIFDGDDRTAMEVREPNTIKKDNYIGVMYDKSITVSSIRFLMGGGQNHIVKSKVQYTTDGTTWVDVNGQVFDRPVGSTEAIEISGLNLDNVKGVRLICTESNVNPAWMTINSIDINKEPTVHISASLSGDIVVAENGGTLNNILDGDKATEVMLKKRNGDAMAVDATVTIDIGVVHEIESIYIAQGISKPVDILDNAVIEYSHNNQDWTKLADLKNQTEQTVSTTVSARYVRIRNLTEKAIWWRLGEFKVNLASKEEPKELVLTASLEGGLRVANHSSINDGAKNNKVDYIVDKNKSTLAWLGSNTHAENGNIQDNDAILISFNKTARIKEVTLNQGSGDMIADGKVQYKGIDDAWHDWETFTGAGGEVVVTGNEVDAKAIKIIAVGNYTSWWKVNEISVVESTSGVKDYLYTNAQTNILSNEVMDEAAFTLTDGSITLDSQEYIGIKLKRIESLNEIRTAYNGSGLALTLQVSKNGLVFEDVIAGTQDKDARFIRLINKGQQEETIHLTEFKVKINELKPMNFHSSDIVAIPNWQDARDNNYAFDNDITTVNKIGGKPTNGQYIIYDLGQEIDINSLRIYTNDAQTDYIRDAKVQVSNDLMSFHDAFVIGDGVTDTNANSTARETFKNIDSKYPNYIYAGDNNLQLKGRYLRILMTTDYPDRAIVINEIIINNGAYVSPESDKSFVGALEERGHLPSYMIDGDLTTTYKSSIKNSSIKYTISDIKDFKTFRIIQSGEVSHATVKATFHNTTTRGTQETVTIGKLGQSINEFVIPSGKKLVSIEIEWAEKIPEISELLLTYNDVSTGDKTALNGLLSTVINDKWTDDTKTSFTHAKLIAQGIADSQYVTQQTIDGAIALLRSAIDNAKVMGDITDLNEYINNALSNSSKEYTVQSFERYQLAIRDAQTALSEQNNLSQDKCDELVGLILQAKDELIYSADMREMAMLTLQDDNILPQVNFTTDSYKVYTDAKTKLTDEIRKDLSATNQSERVTPKQMKILVDVLKDSMNNLVDVTLLTQVIKQFESYNKTLYTQESFALYEATIQDGKALLVNGSSASILAQIAVINEKKNALVMLSINDLSDVIKDALKAKEEDYTKKSYDSLMTIVKEAQNLLSPTEEQRQAYIKKINDSKNALVSTVALKQRIEDAKKLDQSLYTKKSFNNVTLALKKANEVMNSGSEKEVNKTLAFLSQSIQGLERSGSIELKNYKDKLELKDSSYYTSSSYEAYKKAYNTIMEFSDDISLKELNTAINNLETATTQLVLKKADYSVLKKLINQIPKDLSSYSSQSVKALNDVLASIDYNKNATEQDKVDQYVKNLEEAIKALKKDNITVNPDGDDVVTSDMTNVAALGIMVIIAGIGIYMFMKRKKDI